MKYLILLLFVTSSMVVFSQPKIEFKNTTHEFGDIKEDGGIAETVYEFTNTGNQPLIINNVRASCQCTTPEWTKEPVLPGKNGFVKVGYDPRNRPGAFSRNMNVFTNSQPAVTVLVIKGNVTPRERTVEELFPRAMGPIRWKSNFISMGTMLNTETKTQEIEFLNTSDKPVRLNAIRVPSHITTRFEPASVEPNKEGKIFITYNAAANTAYGTISDRVYLSINNEEHNTYSVGISVTLNEDFSKLSAQELANAPKGVFNSNIFDFGTIKEGERPKYNFVLTNQGKADLHIRSVRAACGCTAVKHVSVIKPGQSTDLSVEFNSRGKKNRQNKSITVITNDPKNPTTILRVMGTVQ
jgi:hypothetical protein